MSENEIAKIVVDAAIKVHRALVPGLLESVYEIVLAHDGKASVPMLLWKKKLSWNLNRLKISNPSTRSNCLLISGWPTCAWAC